MALSNMCQHVTRSIGGPRILINSSRQGLVLIETPASGDDLEALHNSLPENDLGGFFMRQSVSDSDDSRNAGFKTIVNAFLFQPGFPFASVLTGEKINRIFRKHRGLFGENGVYSTAIVLWAFLGQVLRDRKEASCQFAVASIISFARRSGKMPPRKTPVTIV